MPISNQDPTREGRFAQQLKKGILEMLVLQLLASAPSHGYEMILRLRETSGGLLDLKEGTLYPILYRLEDEGCIESAWQNMAEKDPKSRAMPRKVYTMTQTGRQTLQAEKAAWRTFAGCVTNFCGGDQDE